MAGRSRERTFSSMRVSKCRRSSEIGVSSGKRSGSFYTTLNSLIRLGAVKGMRPNTNVNKHAPMAYTSVGRPLGYGGHVNNVGWIGLTWVESQNVLQRGAGHAHQPTAVDKKQRLLLASQIQSR